MITETSALDIVSQYTAALAAGDSARMGSMRGSDFTLDYIHRDATQSEPLTSDETTQFWLAWFGGFGEMDYEVTRTIAGENVVVVQWIFSGLNDKPLEPPFMEKRVEPCDRAIRFRGVTIYEIGDALIQHETTYLDFATLIVELGTEL